MQEQSTEQIFREDSKEMTVLDSSCSPSVSNATSTNVVTSAAATSIITTAVSTFSDNLTFSRLGAVEISFQPTLGSDFSQTFPEQEKTRPVLSGNCDASTFINRTFRVPLLCNLF